MTNEAPGSSVRRHPPETAHPCVDRAAHHAGSEAEVSALRDVVLLYAHGIPAQAEGLGDAWSVCVHAGSLGPARTVLSRPAVASVRPLAVLFTCTLVGETEEVRARFSSAVLRILRSAFNIDVVGRLEKMLLVSLNQFPHCHTTWYLFDNGTEVNVGPVNRDEEVRSVPYCAWGCMLDPGTVAYRIAAVLRGEEIDYDLRRTDLLELAEEAGR